MKNKKSFLNFLFRPRGQIIIALLLFSTIAIAQEQIPPQDEFIVGAPFSAILERRSEEIYYNSYYQTDMNTMLQYAVRGLNSNQGYMQGHNLLPCNNDPGDWIMYYSTCYYTKWEAEQDQTEQSRVGIKNNGGQKVFWDNAWCWSTGNIISPTPAFIYGPHYRQDNRYKGWAHGENRYDVRYYPRFRMGLENQQNADLEIEVCKIKVVYSYRKWESEGVYGDSVCVFREKTLTVGQSRFWSQSDSATG